MTSEHRTGTDVARAEGRPPARHENPGLPPHQYRMTDTDPKAAKRAELQVAALFVISIIGTVLFIVSYLAIHPDGTFGTLLRSNL